MGGETNLFVDHHHQLLPSLTHVPVIFKLNNKKQPQQKQSSKARPGTEEFDVCSSTVEGVRRALSYPATDSLIDEIFRPTYNSHTGKIKADFMASFLLNNESRHRSRETTYKIIFDTKRQLLKVNGLAVQLDGRRNFQTRAASVQPPFTGISGRKSKVQNNSFLSKLGLVFKKDKTPLETEQMKKYLADDKLTPEEKQRLKVSVVPIRIGANISFHAYRYRSPKATCPPIQSTAPRARCECSTSFATCSASSSSWPFSFHSWVRLRVFAQLFSALINVFCLLSTNKLLLTRFIPNQAAPFAKC